MEAVVFLAGLDHNYVEIFVVLRDSVYGSLSKLPPPLLLEYRPILKQYTWTNHQQSRYYAHYATTSQRLKTNT